MQARNNPSGIFSICTKITIINHVPKYRKSLWHHLMPEGFFCVMRTFRSVSGTVFVRSQAFFKRDLAEPLNFYKVIAGWYGQR